MKPEENTVIFIFFFSKDRNNTCVQGTEQIEISWKYRNKNVTKIARKMYLIDANVWETTEGKKKTKPETEKSPLGDLF